MFVFVRGHDVRCSSDLLFAWVTTGVATAGVVGVSGRVCVSSSFNRHRHHLSIDRSHQPSLGSFPHRLSDFSSRSQHTVSTEDKLIVHLFYFFLILFLRLKRNVYDVTTPSHRLRPSTFFLFWRIYLLFLVCGTYFLTSMFAFGVYVAKLMKQVMTRTGWVSWCPIGQVVSAHTLQPRSQGFESRQPSVCYRIYFWEYTNCEYVYL